MMLKKLTAVFLCLALLLPFASLFSAAAGTEYIISNPAGAVLYSTASENAVMLTAAKYNTVVTSLNSSGEFIQISYDGYIGWVRAADLSLYGITLFVRDIRLSALPDKTVYYEDDPFLAEGLRVAAVYSDGSERSVSGYEVIVPDMHSVGTKTVTVSYQGKKASFPIQVNRLPIDRIEVTTPPDSINIIEDTDNPVLNGMVLTVYYTDGREPKQVTDYTLTNYDPLKIGQQTATINYKYDDINTTIDINIIPKSVIGLEVKTPAKKNVYFDDDLRIDLEGLVLIARYNNGKSAVVTPETTQFRGGTPAPGAYNDIVLGYADFHASYEVRVNKSEIIGISADPPLKTAYFPGEEPNYGGLIVYAEYSSGKRRGIDDYEVEDFSTDSFGEHVVNVFYETFSTSFTIRVVSLHLFGDVNMDGKINSSDARLALRYSARIDSLSEEQRFLGDINKDGKITSLDARALLRHAAKIELIESED